MKKKLNIFIRLRNGIVKLFLESENDEEILSKPEVLKWIYIFFSVAFFAVIIQLCVNTLYPRGSKYEESLVHIMRILDICCTVIMLVSFVILVIKIYKYLISKGRHLKLDNLLLYYSVGTYIFGRLYARMYVLNQKLFNYLNPPVNITNVVQGGIKVFKLELDFSIYSFLTSFTTSYYKISANHNLVSLVNICQLVFTFFVLTFLISLFIQKQKT